MPKTLFKIDLTKLMSEQKIPGHNRCHPCILAVVSVNPFYTFDQGRTRRELAVVCPPQQRDKLKRAVSSATTSTRQTSHRLKHHCQKEGNRMLSWAQSINSVASC